MRCVLSDSKTLPQILFLCVSCQETQGQEPSLVILLVAIFLPMGEVASSNTRTPGACGLYLKTGPGDRTRGMVTFLTPSCHRCLPLGSPGLSLGPAGDFNKAANEGPRNKGCHIEVRASLAVCPTASLFQTLPGSLHSRRTLPPRTAPHPAPRFPRQLQMFRCFIVFLSPGISLNSAFIFNFHMWVYLVNC